MMWHTKTYKNVIYDFKMRSNTQITLMDCYLEWSKLGITCHDKIKLKYIQLLSWPTSQILQLHSDVRLVSLFNMHYTHLMILVEKKVGSIYTVVGVAITVMKLQWSYYTWIDILPH